MARMSEAMCKEVIRGETSQMLYPYPEYEKPYPVVILDTTAGDIFLEMHLDVAPKTCHSFLDHCRDGYFEPCLFNRIQKDLWVQCGDPTSTGRGGESIYGPTFDDELTFQLKHDKPGVVSMCNKRTPNTNGSQFFITLNPCPWLNDTFWHFSGCSVSQKHRICFRWENVIFGQVVKGMDILKKMNKLPVNKYDRPLDHIFLTRTLVVERPRHYEWRPHAESYGCFNSKGSQLRESIYIDKPKRYKGSYRFIRQMSAKVVKPTHQDGWMLWNKKAF